MHRSGTRNTRIIIIGAGIGGLAAASALRQRGYEAHVYERASALTEVGAGLQLGPNAVKVFKALGLEDNLRANASEPTKLTVLNWNDSSLWSREPLKGVTNSKYGGSYMTMHRADLHRIFHDTLAEGSIHLGMQCASVSTSKGTAAARFTDGSEVEADIIIAADGIRSVIRQQLFGAEEPRFTGMVSWRAIVPMECMPLRLGPQGSVQLEQGEAFSWLGPTGRVLCYPIGGKGEWLNIFAGAQSNVWADESWTTSSSREELLAAYAGWDEVLLELLSNAGENCFKWGIFDRDPRFEWTKGRVTLLGDAAHPTMPTLAQGANMAIEDGYVFAKSLARHPEDIGLALTAYLSERLPRTGMVQLQSRKQFANNLKVPPPPFIDRSWIYYHDVTRDAAA